MRRSVRFRVIWKVLLTWVSRLIGLEGALLLAESALTPEQFIALKTHYHDCMAQEWHCTNGIPGISAAFFRGKGKPQALALGYANPTSEPLSMTCLDDLDAIDYVVVPPRTEIVPETLFEVGSITKTVTAALILQQRDRGVLDLDQNLSACLASTRAEGAFWTPTLRQLLTMRSGIADGDQGPPAAIPAGQRDHGYCYSNTNYQLLGDVLTKSRPRPGLAALFAEMKGKLGLRNTFLGGSEAVPDGRRAMGFNAKGLPRVDSRAFVRSYTTAGALISTAQDVASWIYHLNQPNRVLKAQSLVEMRSTLPLETATPLEPSVPALMVRGYGLGLMEMEVTCGDRVVTLLGHPGRTGGFQSLAAYLPEQGLGFALMINRRDAKRFAEIVCKTVEILISSEQGSELISRAGTSHDTSDLCLAA